MKKLKLSKKDKIAYALIVLLGVIAFVVSTFLLMEPKEADAASQTVTIIRDGVETDISVPDIRDCDISYWLSLDFGTYPYNVTDTLPDRIVSECKYMIVQGNSSHFEYFFYKDEPFYHDGDLTGQQNIFVYYDKGYFVDVYLRDGVYVIEAIYGCYDFLSNSGFTSHVMSQNGVNSMIGSTYDYLVNCTDTRKSNIPRGNLTYPETGLYWDPSLDAWDRLGNVPENVSLEYLSEGKWKIIHESLPDALGTGPVYPWASFQIALPSLDWVKSWEGKSKEDVCVESEILRWRTESYDVLRYFDILDYVPDDDNKGRINFFKDYFYIDLKSYISDNWFFLYGDLSEEYLDYVVEYAYPDVLVLRSFYISYNGRVFSSANIIRMYTLSLGLSWNHESIYPNGGSSLQKVSSWLSGLQNWSDEEQIINDLAALKTELQKKNELIRELQTQIEWLQAEVNRLLRDSSSNIVEIFDDLVDALAGLPVVFSSLGMVIGSVLSFLPGPITTLIIAGLGAWIIASIVKAIRG